jgi:hypothetical protein
VELYARVRRAVDKMSEREAAREFGLARETVRKMRRYSVPPAQAPLIGYALIAAFALYSARLATGAGSLTAVQASIADRVAAQ